MADYIYLLENRLSAAQQRAIRTVRDLARTQEMTIFLTGGAVRDLTSGSAVRDLDLTVVGEAGTLRDGVVAAGAILTGENAPAKALYFLFPGGVRVEVSSAMSVEFPKPGKPVYTAGSISDDLRRRDFTANAMALSLNEGSYGLLMDPLNGVADIENRELRLISNYGFIEDPTRMIRATRIGSRLGWHMEERTRQRYDNAKEENLLGSASNFHRAYELEEIFHEEDPVRVMRALDGEGWLKQLSPELAAAKPNEAGLADLREKQGQLLTQGILADAASLALPLVLSKSSSDVVAGLKKAFARDGFMQQVDSLEERTRELQTRFAGKEAAQPSAAWRMLHEAEPELVLSMFVSGKGTVQARLKTFLNDSPTARQRIPYATLQEMRITPDLPGYTELLDKLFFELMDGKLGTPEEMKAFLEPYSPPAPPPPVNLRRARAKKEARPSRAKAKKSAPVEAAPETVAQQEEALGVAEGLMQPGTLTGPDRGTAPTIDEPLEGKVAPLAPGEDEPKVKQPTKVIKAPAVSPDAEAPAARKLSAKPVPVAKEDRAALTPHPEAARDIAAKGRVTIPEAVTAAAVEAPVKKAAKVVPQSKASIPAKTSAAKAPAEPAPVATKSAAKPSAKPSTKATPARAATPKTVAKKAAKVVTGKNGTKSSQAAKSPVKTGKPAVKKAVKSAPAKKSPAKVPAKKVAAKNPPAKKVATKKAPVKAAVKKGAASKTARRR